MEIILVIYVNEQLKINKTLQLIWDRNFRLNSKFCGLFIFLLEKQLSWRQIMKTA